jgi:hypothetical protein
MAKVKRGTTITRTAATPPTAGEPAEAPLRLALTAGTEEAETASARLNNPHATGADRVPVLKAHLTAAQTRAAHEKATGKRPAAKAAVKHVKKSAQPAVTETY